jgi:hypothetical protein
MQGVNIMGALVRVSIVGLNKVGDIYNYLPYLRDGDQMHKL